MSKRPRIRGAFICASNNYEVTIQLHRPKRYFISIWGREIEIKKEETLEYSNRGIKIIIK